MSGCSVRNDYAFGRVGPRIPHSLALARHMGLNLIRLGTSIKSKRLPAATSDKSRPALLGFEAHEEDEDGDEQ